MLNLAALDAHLVSAARFVATGNKQRALEELGDARVLVKEAGSAATQGLADWMERVMHNTAPSA